MGFLEGDLRDSQADRRLSMRKDKPEVGARRYIVAGAWVIVIMAVGILIAVVIANVVLMLGRALGLE